jgi:hypothetical protein
VFNDKDEGIVISDPFIDFNARHKYAETVARLHGDLKQPGASEDYPLYTKSSCVMMLPTRRRNGSKEDTEIEIENGKKKNGNGNGK